MAAVNGISQREQELLAKVKELEGDRQKFIEIVRGKIQKLENELEVSRNVPSTLCHRYTPILSLL